MSARSTVDAVLDQLQAQVSGGAWPVGRRIPAETDLAARLGVSRPAVREAIRALVHVGVLEVRRGDGTYVRSTADPRPLLSRVARASIRDFFEVQVAYDVQAARLAALRRTDADLGRLERLLSARDEATGPEAFGTADAAFHLGIAEASRNPVLIEAMRFFIDRLRDTLRDIRLGGEIPEAGPAAHRAVLDAIAARDPEAAAAAAAAVVEPALAALEALSTDTPPTDAPTEPPDTPAETVRGNAVKDTVRGNAVKDVATGVSAAGGGTAGDTSVDDRSANDRSANDPAGGDRSAGSAATDGTSTGSAPTSSASGSGVFTAGAATGGASMAKASAGGTSAGGASTGKSTGNTSAGSASAGDASAGGAAAGGAAAGGASAGGAACGGVVS